MINRVLIRIKVVQMLYCYLLTQGEFKLKQAPTTHSRDKKFAYSVYCDLLLMILRLSGFKTSPKSRAIAGADDNRYLSANKIARMLFADSDMKELGVKTGDLYNKYGDVISNLYDAITRSSIYRSYIRQKQHDLQTDVTLWTTLLSTVFAKSPELLAAMRKSEDFTVTGFEQGMEMAVESLFQLTDTRSAFIGAKKSLEKSLDQAYHLYHALLALPVELTRVEDMRLDNARNKYLATEADLNPNTRFVDNELVSMLAQNPEMEEYFSAHPFSWNDNPDLVRSLLGKITSSKIYEDYMAAEDTDLKSDCDFWRAVMKNIILPSDDLAEYLESMSVYWNDDLDIVGTFVLKTIKRIAAADKKTSVLLPQFKDNEDARFGNDLFVGTAEHFEEYREYIDKFIDSRQWDSDRLAFMDVVIMATAIDELLNYPSIPIPVTLNEYIEIANCYSTPRSGQFINGILYSVINYLKEEGKLNKN